MKIIILILLIALFIGQTSGINWLRLISFILLILIVLGYIFLGNKKTKLVIGIVLMSISIILYSYSIFELKSQYERRLNELDRLDINTNYRNQRYITEQIKINRLGFYEDDEDKGRTNVLSTTILEDRTKRLIIAHQMAKGKTPSEELQNEWKTLNLNEMWVIEQEFINESMNTQIRLNKEKKDINDKIEEFNIVALFLQIIGLIAINVASFSKK